jgi:hypothetical protein
MSFKNIFFKDNLYFSDHTHQAVPNKKEGYKEVLSKNCEGCALQQTECKKRFNKAQIWDKVYCPDGTAHLIDS